MCHTKRKRLKRGDLAANAMLSREWIWREMKRGKGRVSYELRLTLLHESKTLN